MYKLATVAVLVAALSTPAAAVGDRTRSQNARVAAFCQDPVFMHGKGYTSCGEPILPGLVTVWVCNPGAGRIHDPDAYVALTPNERPAFVSMAWRGCSP